MSRIFTILPALIFAVSVRCFAADVPEGFESIFNGKDITGWHGMPHFDPRKLAAMSEEEAAAKKAEWNASANEH